VALMNLFDQGLLDSPIGLFAALAVGLLFGFWLERSGFGSSRKLTSIFYFDDWAVLKVMFTAMVVAALGLQLLGGLGIVDLQKLYVPATVVWPQLVGGLVFGIGFVMGGWCPGTAAVGLGSGRIDALVFLAGAGIGSLLFAGLQPRLGDFLQAGACDVGSLPERLGVSPGMGALLLLAIALVAFAAATKVETMMARRRHEA
jgi:uncharacterized membrane protein YedE/YeeE